MKRVVKATSVQQEEFLKHAKKIYAKSKELLDAIENAPDEVTSELDISDLYDVLIEDIPSIAFAIKTANKAKAADRPDFMW